MEIDGLLQNFQNTGKILKPDFKSIKPKIYNLQNREDHIAYQKLIEKEELIFWHDQFESQIKELFKIRNASTRLNEKHLDQLFREWKSSHDTDTNGLWVYYPWSKKMVHIVSKAEFIELRTSRNKYKITPTEQHQLENRTVGVIGLSVGQSVAVTMAIERVFGRIKIADFDILELTNLNRIRKGIDALGMSKAVMVAREIAEIDPFLEVEVYKDGITEENIGEFLEGDYPLDLLIEECDSLDIKVLARLEARKRKIPVIMDTSDRGMIDIERFDLEPDRKILHGLIEVENLDKLKGLSYEEKIPIILQLVGADQMSKRLKSSMIEINNSLTTWPQLVSEVTLGGAICTSIARSILLKQPVKSGRFYMEQYEYLEKSENENEATDQDNKIDYLSLIDKYSGGIGVDISDDERLDIITKSTLAPSAGNVQPWKIFYKQGAFYIFLDPERCGFYGDYKLQASIISVGAFIENMLIALGDKGYEVEYEPFPIAEEEYFVGVITAKRQGQAVNDPLSPYISSRHTNRNIVGSKPISSDFIAEIKSTIKEFEGYNYHFTSEKNDLLKIGEIVGKADRRRILNKEGHQGFFDEIRWNDGEAKKTGDGIDVETVDIKASEIAGFQIASDWEAIEVLDEMNLAYAFVDLSKESIEKSDGVLVFSCEGFDKFALLKAGQLIERAWLICTKYGISVQPLLSTCLFYNMKHFGTEVLDNKTILELEEMEPEYLKIFKDLKESDTQVFLMRLSGIDGPYKPSYRRPINDVYTEL